MSRTTNYEQGLFKDSKEDKIDPEEVKKKIGKEAITTDEMAEFLSHYSSLLADDNKPRTFTGRNIRQKIQAICDNSNGRITVDTFKRKLPTGQEAYYIAPEYQAYLLALIDCKYLDNNKNMKRLSTRQELNQALIRSIDTYMPKKDLESIQTNPAYMNAKLEALYYEALNKYIHAILSGIANSDEVIRYQLMDYSLRTLIDLEKYIGKVDARMMSSKMIYEHQLDENNEYEKKSLVETETLEDYIMELLILKIEGKAYEYLSEDELLSYPALWAAANLYDIEIKPGTDADKELKEITKAINDDEKFKKLKDKAEQILDLNDPTEALMYRDIIRMSAQYYLAPFVDAKTYEKTVKFTESAIKDEKFEALNRFANCREEMMNPFLAQLRRINSLRGLDPDNKLAPEKEK